MRCSKEDSWCDSAWRLSGSSNKRPWLLAALVARELELLALPAPLPLDAPLVAWLFCKAICCCCRRIWISEEVRPSEVSGIEAETDIWSRQRHTPTATVYEAPIKLEVRPSGPQFMVDGARRGGRCVV